MEKTILIVGGLARSADRSRRTPAAVRWPDHPRPARPDVLHSCSGSVDEFSRSERRSSRIATCAATKLINLIVVCIDLTDDAFVEHSASSRNTTARRLDQSIETIYDVRRACVPFARGMVQLHPRGTDYQLVQPESPQRGVAVRELRPCRRLPGRARRARSRIHYSRPSASSVVQTLPEQQSNDFARPLAATAYTRSAFPDQVPRLPQTLPMDARISWLCMDSALMAQLLGLMRGLGLSSFRTRAFLGLFAQLGGKELPDSARGVLHDRAGPSDPGPPVWAWLRPSRANVVPAPHRGSRGRRQLAAASFRGSASPRRAAVVRLDDFLHGSSARGVSFTRPWPRIGWESGS